MRIQAIRASETLYKAGDGPGPRTTAGSPKDPDVDVVIQAMLTLNVLKVPDAAATIQAAQAANPARGVQEIGRQILNPPPLTYGRAGAAFSDEELSCHAARRRDLQRAVLLVPWRRWPRRARAGAAAGAIMAPAFVGNSRVTGHPRLRRQGPAARPDGSGRRPDICGRRDGADGIQSRRVDCVGRVVHPQHLRQCRPVRHPCRCRPRPQRRPPVARRTGNSRRSSRQCPRPTASDGSWKATASHNSDKAAQAFNFATWTTTVLRRRPACGSRSSSRSRHP